MLLTTAWHVEHILFVIAVWHLVLPSSSSSQVAVPMRFNGKSGVQVRLPNDLEDLKGYTSLSLFLQRPDLRENGGTEDMFVMYLGNKDVSVVQIFLLFY